jgi:hypothetical protein
MFEGIQACQTVGCEISRRGCILGQNPATFIFQLLNHKCFSFDWVRYSFYLLRLFSFISFLPSVNWVWEERGKKKNYWESRARLRVYKNAGYIIFTVSLSVLTTSKLCKGLMHSKKEAWVCSLQAYYVTVSKNRIWVACDHCSNSITWNNPCGFFIYLS